MKTILILIIMSLLTSCSSKSMITRKECGFTPIQENIYCSEWSYSSDKLFEMLEASVIDGNISIKVESVRKQTSGYEEIGKALIPTLLEKAKL